MRAAASAPDAARHLPPRATGSGLCSPRRCAPAAGGPNARARPACCRSGRSMRFAERRRGRREIPLQQVGDDGRIDLQRRLVREVVRRARIPERMVARLEHGVSSRRSCSASCCARPGAENAASSCCGPSASSGRTLLTPGAAFVAPSISGSA